MNTHGIFIQPHGLAKEYPSHVQWSGSNRILSPPECEAIIDAAGALGWQPGTIGSPTEHRHDPSYRCVEVCTLPYAPSIDWLYERITTRVVAANEQYYGFDLAGLLETVQVLRYTAAETAGAPNGHYNWHQDFGAGYMGRRKLSVVIQLSDGHEYEGCQLTLMGHRLETMPYRGAGDGVAFPSWTPHYVSEITRGVRHALVAWVHGSPFR
jgi:PKHD-type hydroxylase